MSLKWLNTVWNTSKEKGGRLLGLMAIADEANDDGIARPNVKNVAHKMRMSERTASRVINGISQDELAVALLPGYRSVFCVLVGRPADEIKAIRSWLKQLPTTPDKMSPPPRHFVVPTICRPDKMSTRFLINNNNLNPHIGINNNPLSSSSDDDDEFYKMLKAAGVWKRDIQAIRSSDITFPDFMAELSRCYDDPKVRKPARIAPMNLLRGDRPSRSWYERSAWFAIPREVLEVGYPTLLQEQDKSSDNSMGSDYAKEPEKKINGDETITDHLRIQWQMVTNQLKVEMPRAAYDAHVRDTTPVHFENDQLTISAKDPEWCTSRLASTVERLMVGVLNAPVKIAFIQEE